MHCVEVTLSTLKVKTTICIYNQDIAKHRAAYDKIYLESLKYNDGMRATVHYRSIENIASKDHVYKLEFSFKNDNDYALMRDFVKQVREEHGCYSSKQLFRVSGDLGEVLEALDLNIELKEHPNAYLWYSEDDQLGLIYQANTPMRFDLRGSGYINVASRYSKHCEVLVFTVVSKDIIERDEALISRYLDKVKALTSPTYPSVDEPDKLDDKVYLKRETLYKFKRTDTTALRILEATIINRKGEPFVVIRDEKEDYIYVFFSETIPHNIEKNKDILQQIGVGVTDVFQATTDVLLKPHEQSFGTNLGYAVLVDNYHHNRLTEVLSLLTYGEVLNLTQD